MKTTIDLPDELLRTIKVRAVHEDKTVKELVTELLEIGLAYEHQESDRTRARVQLPLVRCAHGAHPDEEMTPERVASVLAEDEADGARTR